MIPEEEKQQDELTDTGREIENEFQGPEENGNEKTGHWPEDEAVAPAGDELLAAEKDRYLRLYSEFDNFKKRTARERIEFLTMAGRDVISDMLPVIDDLERALKSTENAGTDMQATLDGFKLIHKKMLGLLEARGLKPMQSIGEAFDAEIHEAVTKIPAPSDNLRGKVIDEVEKGYYMHDKVIRFAKVIVGE